LSKENKKIKKNLISWFENHPKYYIGNHLSSNSILRVLTAPLRTKANFIIIGSISSGTTSLYNYLIQHPKILPAYRKEIYFFDLNYSKGINWYRAYFPLFWEKQKNFVTGEATATYLRHPLCPKRIALTLPNVKMIILLRNPVDRAYAFYHSRKEHGDELMTFEEAIEQEDKRLEGEMARMLDNEEYFARNYYTYGYLSGGIYIEQLKKWMEIFPKKQFLILQSEKFFDEPSKTLDQVTKFLELPNFELSQYKKYNKHKYPEMKSSLREKLLDFFIPHNEQLYNFLNQRFDWDN